MSEGGRRSLQGRVQAGLHRGNWGEARGRDVTTACRSCCAAAAAAVQAGAPVDHQLALTRYCNCMDNMLPHGGVAGAQSARAAGEHQSKACCLVAHARQQHRRCSCCSHKAQQCLCWLLTQSTTVFVLLSRMVIVKQLLWLSAVAVTMPSDCLHTLTLLAPFTPYAALMCAHPPALLVTAPPSPALNCMYVSDMHVMHGYHSPLSPSTPHPMCPQVFKTCLDYWNYFVPDIYASSCAVETAMVFSFAPVPTPSPPKRKQLFAGILSKLRQLMICRMAKPEEVRGVLVPGGVLVWGRRGGNAAQQHAVREAGVMLKLGQGFWQRNRRASCVWILE